MGISQSILAIENGPERDERMEEAPAPEAERNSEEPTTGLVPSAGTLELQQGGEAEVPTSRRHTEVLELPKVDRGSAPATPAIRPGGESSTPATKSRAERKQEKKTARKEEKRNRRAEKSAKKAEKAEEEKPEGTPPKTPVRRKLDAAMETAGSIESVLLLEREYKALQRDPSHRPNFYFLIDRLISNLRYIPRTVFGPPAGEEERIKLTKLREEEEAEEAEAAQRAAEGADEGSASRKRKLEELEEKKRALEEENDRKRKELEEESRRLKAVEEAERRAREQRSRNPRVQVPVASEKEKGETWFERKATELVENYIQSYGPQQKKSKEAAETYTTACKNSEQAHEDFISALQKTQEKAEVLQKCLGRALEAAMAFGREEERAQQYAQAKDKCSRPEVPRVKARPQIPAGLQKESGKREPSRKSLVNLGRRKDLKYQRQPSQDRSGEFVLESNRLRKNQERNGEKRFLKMSGKLEDCSRKMKSTWSAPTTHSHQNGKRSCERSYSIWHTVGLPRRKMESCIRREDLDCNFSRPENSKVSTSPWSETMESGWYGKARKLKENRNRSTTSIVTPLEGERWRKLRSSGSSTQYWGLYPRIKVCAPFAGLRATGKVDASSKTWFSNYGNRLWQCWFRLNDYASTILAGISYANGTSMTRTTTSSTSTQQSHLLITVQSAARFPKLTLRDTRMRSCEVLNMKFSSTAVGGVENRIRVIHLGGFTETMVFFDLHTHPKIFGLPDRHLVSKRDFGHWAGNF